MHHFIPQVTLISALLFGNVKAQGASISISFPQKDIFGKPFDVEFSNPNPANTNWIGIYKRNVNPTVGNTLLWSTMCGNQNSLNSAAPCPPKASGFVTFKVEDPDLDDEQSSPLNPGTYKVINLHRIRIFIIGILYISMLGSLG